DPRRASPAGVGDRACRRRSQQGRPAAAAWARRPRQEVRRGMTEKPLIDRAVLDELYDAIGEEGARSVLQVFIDECRNYLVTIAAAAAQPSDVAARNRARRAAHSLKSGAAQIGAPA